MIGIYKITNLLNGCSYIGQSSNIENRIQQHFFYYKHEKSVLHANIKKYGVKNFSWEILEICSLEELDQKEKYWINYYNTFKNGYNRTLGGQCGSNQSKYQIIQIDPTNLEIVNKYACQSEVLDLLKVSRQSLSEALNQQKILKQFYWCYDNNIDIYKLSPKGIRQYDIQSGKLLFTYKNYSEALKAIGVENSVKNRALLCKILTGKRKNHIAFGYLWDKIDIN